MESPRLPDPAPDDSLPSSPRNRLMVVAMLCAPLLVGGLLLFGTRGSPPPPSPPVRPGGMEDMRPILSPPDGTDELPHVPDFPDSGSSPAGDVSLQNVRFAPTTVPSFMGPFQRVIIQYIGNDEIKLTVDGTNKDCWRGSIEGAVFVEETVAGVRTIKEDHPQGGGRLLWSNAAESVPDLQLQREKDGQSRLLDGNRTVLWSGRLRTSPRGSSSSSRGNTRSIKAGGVHINSVDGAFTVQDAGNGSLLWSGHLPGEPVLLVRDGHDFTFQSPHRGESGRDNTKRVRFEKEAGAVTATDRNGKMVGTRPVTILKTYQTREIFGEPRLLPTPIQYATPDGVLTADGTIFLSYADSRGRIIRRSKVFKHARGSGRFN